MDAAVATEALKLRRSPVARTAWLAVVLGAPALSAGFIAVARAGGDGQLAVKVAAMLPDMGWIGYLGMIGQISTVAMLLAGGIVTAWSSVGNSPTERSSGCSPSRCHDAGWPRPSSP